MSWLDRWFNGVKTIRNAGVDLPFEPALNFIGATVADNPTTGATDVTIAAGSTLGTLEVACTGADCGTPKSSAASTPTGATLDGLIVFVDGAYGAEGSHAITVGYPGSVAAFLATGVVDIQNGAPTPRNSGYIPVGIAMSGLQLTVSITGPLIVFGASLRVYGMWSIHQL